MPVLTRYAIMAMFAMMMTLTAVAAHTAEVKGVYFQDSLRLKDTRLSILGTGVFRYLGFINAYVGALYIDEQTPIEKRHG